MMMEMEVSCVVTVMADDECGSPVKLMLSYSELCGSGKVTAMECSERRRRSAELTVEEAGLHSADMSAGVVCDVSLVEMVLLTSRSVRAAARWRLRCPMRVAVL